MQKKLSKIEKQKRKLWILVAILVLGLFIARHFIREHNFAQRQSRQQKTSEVSKDPRIVVIGDNLVEICLSLGLTDSIVAVGYASKLPSELKDVQNLGVMNISEEQLIKTNLNMLIASDSAELKNRIQTIINNPKIQNIFIRHENFNHIIKAIKIISEATNKTDIGEEIITEMQAEIDIERVPTEDAPSALIVFFAQKDESGGFNKFYVAGEGTFLDEILRSAGGKNALPKSEIPWPSLSVEDLIKFNPDIIFDLRPDYQGSTDEVLKIWEITAPLKAVKNGNIFVITEHHSLIPSPKIIEIHKLFKNLISQSKPK